MTQTLRRDSNGFSLLEVLVGMSLMAIALLGVAYTTQQQAFFRASTVTTLAGKRAIAELTASLISSPERFIYFEDSSSNPVVYVGCFNNKGEQISTDSTAPVSTSDFLGTFGINPASTGNASGDFNGILASYCKPGFGGWEVHVFPDPSGKILVSSIVLPNGSNTNIAVANVAVTRITVATRAPAAALTAPAGPGFDRTLLLGQWCNSTQRSGNNCTNGALPPTTTSCVPQDSLQPDTGATIAELQLNSAPLYFCY
jgi:prepilin-type N-terminal cleavage/methylation domain-containing protein